MEDHSGVLLENKLMFISIIESVLALRNMRDRAEERSKLMELSDNALLFIELIKEFYMNFPLRDESSMLMKSVLNDVEFGLMKFDNTRRLRDTLKPHIHSSATDDLNKVNPNILQMSGLQSMKVVPGLRY
jgi:hypothetical protein